MTPVDLRMALPDALVPRLPRSRAGLAARLRALSAARLAVAIFLGGGGAHVVTTDAGDARGRHRPSIATARAAAA